MNAAFWEIYRHGYHAVGVRDLAKKANVTIGAFFHYFPTKNHVAYAILDEVVHNGILDRWIRPLAAYKNPVQGMVKCFKNTFESWPDELVSTGCPLNNLTQELSTTDETIKARAKMVLLDWMEKTQVYLEKAQETGYLDKKVDTKELAQFIVTFQEGTFAMGKALNDRKVYDSMYKSFKRHLESVST